jgi:hypothetical protein
MKTIAAIFAAAIASVALASCPNQCSGKGICTADDKCECWTGYIGYDCSERACPYTAAWAVDDFEGAHQYAECANKGICDRSTGLCECFPGYEGRACERSACPNSCSGHGKCRMIADLEKVNAGQSTSDQNSYTWDERAITACVCDGGYMGPDCSQRVCPFGDDPMTVCEQGDTEQIQKVVVKIPSATPEANSVLVNTEFALRYTDTAGNEWSTGTLTGIDDTASAVTNSAVENSVEAGLEALPNFAVEDVDVAANLITTAYQGTSIAVTFKHEASGNNFGTQNLLKCPTPRVIKQGTSSTAGYTTFGCGAVGCQPRIKQPRLEVTAVAATGATLTVAASQPVAFTDDSVLTCPKGVTCEDGNGAGVKANAAVLMQFVGSGASAQVFASAVAPSGMRDDFDDLDVQQATPAVTWTFLGVLGDFPATGNVYRVPLTQVMDDTWANVDITTAANSADKIFELGYIAATCEDGVDITVDFVDGGADNEHTGSPFENNNIENIECSGRGQCNRGSGQCECYEGYMGLNCGSQTILI